MNRIYAWIGWLACLTMCLPSCRIQAQLNVEWTHYSAEEGLSQNAVMDMLQDHRGLMWLATWDGVNSFDGYNFKQYKTASDSIPGLSNNRIEKIIEEENDTFDFELEYNGECISINNYDGSVDFRDLSSYET